MRLNWRLDDVTLVPTMRKPFDVLAEGLLSKKVGTTRRLLNFFWGASGAGTQVFGDRRTIVEFHRTPETCLGL